MDMNDSKPTLTIFRGIAGSGKSTLAEELARKAARNGPAAVICSADDHFMVNGEYQFDVTELGNAHGSCFRKAVEALQAGLPVIIDNTNTSVAETSVYVAMGQAYAGETQIIRVECDPQVAFERNTHGVPQGAVEAMAERLANEPLPPFFPAETVVGGQ